jgi:NinB protein
MKRLIQNESGLLALIAELPKLIKYPSNVTIEKLNPRTVEQNRQQWPILHAFAEQKFWEVGGVEQKITEYDWKDILTASYAGERLRLSPTLDGSRMVALGLRTSKFKQVAETEDDTEWNEWMAFLKWAAAEHGIKVPISKKMIDKYMQEIEL